MNALAHLTACYFESMVPSHPFTVWRPSHMPEARKGNLLNKFEMESHFHAMLADTVSNTAQAWACRAACTEVRHEPLSTSTLPTGSWGVQGAFPIPPHYLTTGTRSAQVDYHVQHYPPGGL